MTAKIQGIFTPNVVPLQDNGDINEPELRRYVDWLIAKGVHGLYPNGSTGEFTRFTPEERRRIVKIVCEQAAGRVPVLAGAAEANVRETLAACETYAGYGARAVAIVSPFYYKLCPESVYAYFREIALQQPDRRDALQHPHVRQPDRRAHDQAAGRVRADRGHQGFVGRHGLHDADDRRPCGRVRPDFVFLTGWDAVLVPMLLDRLRRRHERHQRRRARADAEALRPDPRRPDRRGHAAAVPHAGAVRRDALLGRFSRGLPGGGGAARVPASGRSRQPQSDKQKIDYLALQNVLRCILADFGYVDAPAGGCPPRTGNIDQDRISHITAAVVRELRERGTI